MKIKWEIQPQAMILAALCIMILPPAWLAAAAAAALFHEMAHILTIRICSGTITGITISPCGASICVGPMTPFQELICAAAGPLASFSLIALCRFFPLVSLAGFIQGAFNLLPIYPSDGGRIVSALAVMAFPKIAHKIIQAAEILTALLVAAAGYIAISVFRTRLEVVGVCIFLILRPLVRKIPCKERSMRVQ